MDKNKKKNNKNNNLFIILILVVIVISIFLFVKKCRNEKDVQEPAEAIDAIKTNDFDYTLYNNKSKVYQEYFNKLKDELTKEVVDDNEYAKLVSELFVIDFYSLSDKKTSTDVGGLDFILDSIKDNFTLKATDTIYKYVESNVYGDRKQELPSVSAIEVTKIDTQNVTIGDLTDENGYKLTLSVTYEKDMGYPNEVTITLVHKDKKIYVVEVK